jgi:seryl-tRNA synthetase
MIDRRLVAQDPDRIRQNLARRHAPDDQREAFETLVGVLSRRRDLQTETDSLRADRNALTKQIGPLMKAGKRDEALPLRERVKALGDTLDGLEDERKRLEEEELLLLQSVPNMLHDDVPDGGGEDDNIELRRWGTPRAFDFEVRDHVALGEALGILDFGRAAKLSGARFPVYKGAGARLERALINFFLDQATQHNGYTEFVVPYIVSRTTMTGTGQLPKFEHDLFKLTTELDGQDAYLIPTAEVPLTNLHAGEILDAGELPLSYTGFTPCFRSEAGSYGRDVRGLMRQHQFHKVELVKVTTAEDGPAAHELLTSHAEGLLQALELPYRVEVLCGGDTSFTAQKTYDLEVWVPSQGRYREISSCSHFGDFQARRMNLRYRPADGGKPQYGHTVNGSGLAVGRTVVAILENHQQSDGSIEIPVALQPYMGGLARIEATE